MSIHLWTYSNTRGLTKDKTIYLDLNKSFEQQIEDLFVGFKPLTNNIHGYILLHSTPKGSEKLEGKILGKDTMYYLLLSNQNNIVRVPFKSLRLFGYVQLEDYF